MIKAQKLEAISIGIV
jgi:hypothetical protein